MTVPVRTLLADATDRLTAAGVLSPRVDAELLLAELLAVNRTALFTRESVPDVVAQTYEQHVARRVVADLRRLVDLLERDARVVEEGRELEDGVRLAPEELGQA